MADGRPILGTKAPNDIGPSPEGASSSCPVIGKGGSRASADAFLGQAPRVQGGASPSEASPHGAAGYPAMDAETLASAQAAGCPVVHSAGTGPEAGVAGAAPSSLNGQTASVNRPLPGQSKPLSTWRQPSTIPTAAPVSALPPHQGPLPGDVGAGGGGGGGASACPVVGTDSSAPPQQQQQEQQQQSGTWTYPSEQMFFNAMRRKGWNPSEDDMTAVVAVHNAVNERAWREILRWEAAHHGVDPAAGTGPTTGGGGAEGDGSPPRARALPRRGRVDASLLPCGGPQLVRFRGRPQDFSPKARILNALGYRLPFDRHDWVIDRCGKEVRYVIDFYDGAAPGMPAAMHLDVRPALDSPTALWDRLVMQWGWATGRGWSGR